jgi:hypothetical protein
LIGTGGGCGGGEAASLEHSGCPRYLVTVTGRETKFLISHQAAVRLEVDQCKHFTPEQRGALMNRLSIEQAEEFKRNPKARAAWEDGKKLPQSSVRAFARLREEYKRSQKGKKGSDADQ